MELTEYQKEILRVTQLSVSDIPKDYTEMNKLIWEAYNYGLKHRQYSKPLSELINKYQERLFQLRDCYNQAMKISDVNGAKHWDWRITDCEELLKELKGLRNQQYTIQGSDFKKQTVKGA